MTFFGTTKSRLGSQLGCLVMALGVAASLASPAKADDFSGPSFRKGMWRFVRTLEVVLHSKVKHRLLQQEALRCVDPTDAMKATFATLPVGNCQPAKPERSDNTYTFSSRCDYLGPVSTIITVQSDEAYTEVNLVNVGELPRRDLVTARRVGDCEEGGRGPASH
jgi:hypothetical protein